MSKMLTGAAVVAKALQTQGIKYLFGVVGIPIVEVALAAQEVGIKYVGMRTEQSACYAASAMGYLTKRPGACLVVSGPGLINALSGLANSQVNGWPFLLIGGSSDEDQEGRGAFQEYPQVEASRMYCKYSARPTSIENIPFHIEKAVKCSMYGRPGSAYIDIPGNFVVGEVSEDNLKFYPEVPEPPVMLACPMLIKNAAKTLVKAEKPLVIIGKGSAYSKAEMVIKNFVEKYNLPFLPTPMGKGVVPDTHPLCVSSARSKVLLESDVILLLGARLNWILHFGLPPRFSPDVKIIQIDIVQEELHNNVRAEVALSGDVTAIVEQLHKELELTSWTFPQQSNWWMTLKEKCAANAAAVQEMANDESLPMNYYAAYKQIKDMLPNDALIINEGANTMDIGRTMLPNILPRHRLDAGTFGTMGVGLGFTLAAALWCQDHAPQKRVVCVIGDSAFGFSGMEMETINRFKLPVIIIIINNNGIYNGLDLESWKMLEEEKVDVGLSIPPNSLLPSARYENIAKMFGGKGFYTSTPKELKEALEESLKTIDQPCIINVAIDPVSQRKPQQFPWLTRSKV
ncbi:2-hydroxyacyl-CoA lyase 1 isoform X2 [Centruroides vittatus]|uniref:2-hydroxyacyl-CoA lyase 1 isoform X2 n=1 Tax=Centruroides vittatus TaxID=120091 RepID=UPI00350F5092